MVYTASTFLRYFLDHVSHLSTKKAQAVQDPRFFSEECDPWRASHPEATASKGAQDYRCPEIQKVKRAQWGLFTFMGIQGFVWAPSQQSHQG